MIKSWWNSDIIVLAKRIALLYIVLVICRVIFYIYNAPLLGILPWGVGLWSLLKGAFVFDTVSILYANGVFIMLSLLPFRIRERRWYQAMLTTYYLVINSLVVIVNMADTVYFRYTQKRFTADEIFFANNDNSGQLMLKFASENWYLVTAVILIIAAMAWAYKYCGRPRTPIKNTIAYIAVGTLFLAGAAGLSIGGIRGGFSRSTRPITLSNATLYTPSTTQANLILSNPFCIIRTMGNQKIVYTKYFDNQTLEQIYSPYHYPVADSSLSLGQRNIVIFILESFSSEHSALLNPDLYPNGGGYTPFLDSLMREGYYFTSAFANGHKSIDALPSIFASIPSFSTPFVLMPQALGKTEALPQILANQGYKTSFFCGSPHGSMGFGAYANGAGIKELYSQQTYEKQRGSGDFDGFWGIWDEPFLSYMGGVLDHTTQPFFASVFTLSSHHPFIVPDKYEDSLPKGDIKVHKGIAYTDLSIRKFFEQSASQEWFKNSIFVFTADHVSSEKFAAKTLTPTGDSQIITFIYTPDGAIKGSDNRVMQQINIMPTLLTLTGYNKPYFAYGTDMLSEPQRKNLAVNYTTQSYQAISDSVVVFFEQDKVLSAYYRSDTLQRHDISGVPNDEVEQTQRLLKAIIQQYYSHLEKSDYTVK